jgi:hypothetical protein
MLLPGELSNGLKYRVSVAVSQPSQKYREVYSASYSLSISPLDFRNQFLVTPDGLIYHLGKSLRR